MSILRLMLQTSIAGHHSSRGQTLDREDGFQLQVVSVQEMMPLSLKEFTTWLQIHLLKLESYRARNDAIVIREVYDVATNTSVETRKVEGKLDALVNLVTQLAVNQKPASIARVFGIHSSNDHHKNVYPSSFARNDVTVIRGVHDVATDTSPETRKVVGKPDALVNLVAHLAVNQKPASIARVEGKLDALVNLVTQLAVNRKPASIARVCGIRSSNDHHTNATTVAEARQGVHDVTTDTSAETRKAEGKLDALMNLVTQLVVNQKLASIARVCGIRSSNDHHTNVCPSSQQPGVNEGVHDVATNTSAKNIKVEGRLDATVNLVTQLAVNLNEYPEAYAANIYSRPPQQQRGVHDVATDTSAESRKVEGKLDALVNLVTQLAVNRFLHLLQKGVHDMATDTSAETTKVEGKLDAIGNLVAQLAVNRKPPSVARVCDIRSSNDHHTNVCLSFSSATNDGIVIIGVDDVATDTFAETRKVEGKLDALMNCVTQLVQPGVNGHPEAYAANFARNDAIVIRGVPDVATDTSAETRKVEGKLDALMNLVTQLAVNWNPASVARVCGIRSSNDHYTNAITAAEARHLIEKMASNYYNLDALVNLVTQLAVNRKSASVARQPGVNENPKAYAANVYSRHHSSRGQTLDSEDGFQLLEVSVQEMMPLSLEEFTTRLQLHQLKLESFSARNDAISIRGVHDLATDTSAETRKVEGKLDALVNLVIQLAVNQKPASVERVFGIRSSNDHHTNRRWLPTPRSFRARNDAIVIKGVHDLATDTSTESRKVQGKLDALVNLVTQLAVNQKPASVARPTTAAEAGETLDRKYGFQLLAVSIQEMISLSLEEFTTLLRDTSAETRKVEGKLDALVNLVTQLAVNQKPASIARVCGIRSSNDHHRNVRPSFFSARNDAIVIRGVHDVATDTSAETRKVEGKLDALMNLVTQLAVNRKPASVARVCGIRSSNDHHTNVSGHHSSRGQTLDREDGFQLLAISVQEMMPLLSEEFTTWLQIHLLKLESARNDAIFIRGVHDLATDTSAETRKVEGKLDALVNLVTQLVVNKKHVSVARVYGIHSSNDHHTNRVHDLATDTSAETRKVEGKLDALVNLVTQLAVNQMPASVERVCGIRSSNDHHTNRRGLPTPRSFSARNDAIVIRGVHDVATETSTETRKVEGKLDALVDLVTQLAVNQKPASVASQPGVNEQHPQAYAANIYSRPPQEQRQTLDREDGFQLLAVSVQEMMPLSLEEFTTWLQIHLLKLERAVHDMATDTSTETSNVQGNLYALVNMVTQLAVNQKPASVAREGERQASCSCELGDSVSCESESYLLLQESVASVLPITAKQIFSARNDVIVIRGVHDVATDRSDETRKVEVKLDAIVNLVTQLAVNQKHTTVARVRDIRSSNDHHTNVCPSS
ncbi:hypothetical protein Fmac_024891 [Flemingia macrophylla]|uniref:Uncharacterized protein n=1 Tax=Flemingia macrophylla TaxID=520843 RepID=A0ABD1LRA2_9FABA